MVCSFWKAFRAGSGTLNVYRGTHTFFQSNWATVKKRQAGKAIFVDGEVFGSSDEAICGIYFVRRCLGDHALHL